MAFGCKALTLVVPRRMNNTYFKAKTNSWKYFKHVDPVSRPEKGALCLHLDAIDCNVFKRTYLR